MPHHPSLKPDPNRKGSYYRRIEDIRRALKILNPDELPEIFQFATYYFACDKLAHGIVGIDERLDDESAYKKQPSLKRIKAAAQNLKLPISTDDLTYLFAAEYQQHLVPQSDPRHSVSARFLRNKLAHDFGPTNVKRVQAQADFFIPRMVAFLNCADDTLTYLKANFSDVP